LPARSRYRAAPSRGPRHSLGGPRKPEGRSSMSPLRKFSVVLVCALAYRGLYVVNDFLFAHLVFSKGVHWVFLPAGLRLLLVLLFGFWGALGISLGSVAGACVDQHFDGDVVTATVAGLISGFAPLLARAICVERSMIRDDLVDLGASALLRIALVFSITSSLLHQVWYALRDVSGNFLSGFAVMQIGDLAGSLVVLYLVRALLRAFLRDNPR
jgi:hypothetical protein